MGELRFELTPVDERPKRRFKRRSKYDPIIEGFLSGSHDLVRVDVEDKDASYLRLQLVKIIESRGLVGVVEASVVNGRLYLEKDPASNDII